MVFEFKRNDVVVDEISLLGTVEVFDVIDESLIVFEGVAEERTVLAAVDFTLIGEGEAQSLIEKAHLLKPCAQGFIVEVDGLEGFGTRPERNGRARCIVRFALFQGSVRNTVGKTLAPDKALAANLNLEAARQRVDNGASDAVQATGDGITAAAEFTAGVQHGQNDLNGRASLSLVNVDGNSTTVVVDANGAVGENSNVYGVTVPSKSLVDRVVDDLINEVVQSARSGGPDIHSGSLAYSFQTFKHLDVVGTIFVLKLSRYLPLVLGNIWGSIWGYIGGRAFGRRFNCHLKLGS